jgi:DNA polymerase III subunit chi
MTEVSFHFNVPHRLGYACRLLRKAARQGAKVAVVAPLATLDELDRTLWSFDPIEFVPHVRIGSAPLAPHLLQTPVQLVDDVRRSTHHQVLLNLGDELVQGFEGFARLLEVVSADESERTAARMRWKHYASRGYSIERHEAAPQ